jgi:hypothetical protein
MVRKKDPQVASVTGENAPRNNQMTCPDTQKVVRACAEMTSDAIKAEIGDCLFFVLVDESRDASIKEQMAVVVRSVMSFNLHVSYIFLFPLSILNDIPFDFCHVGMSMIKGM